MFAFLLLHHNYALKFTCKTVCYNSLVAQTVGIMLRSLPCGVSELGEAVRSGDVTLIDRETLQAVHDLVGSLTCLCYQLVCVRIFILPIPASYY